jgi:hypothetical protein
VHHRDEFRRTAGARCFTLSPVAGALLNVRLSIGRLLGWDREPAATKWEPFATRPTPADQSRSLTPAGTREACESIKRCRSTCSCKGVKPLVRLGRIRRRRCRDPKTQQDPVCGCSSPDAFGPPDLRSISRHRDSGGTIDGRWELCRDARELDQRPPDHLPAPSLKNVEPLDSRAEMAESRTTQRPKCL